MASINPPVIDNPSQFISSSYAIIIGISDAVGGREVSLARRDGLHLDAACAGKRVSILYLHNSGCSQYDHNQAECPDSMKRMGIAQKDDGILVTQLGEASSVLYASSVTVPTVGRFRAEGFAILTTQRIIFCAQRPYRTQNGMEFKGFDIPLQMVTGEKFDQPIFGANNLSGIVQTNVAYAGTMDDASRFRDTAMPVINSNWRLSFRNGGFGTFMRVFYRVLNRQRSMNPAATAVAFSGTDNEWVSLQATEVVQAVALDPSDGTVLLAPQPVRATVVSSDMGSI